MIESVDKILGTLPGVIVCIHINNDVLKGLIVPGTVQSMYAQKDSKKMNLETKQAWR